MSNEFFFINLSTGKNLHKYKAYRNSTWNQLNTWNNNSFTVKDKIDTLVFHLKTISNLKVINDRKFFSHHGVDRFLLYVHHKGSHVIHPFSINSDYNLFLVFLFTHTFSLSYFLSVNKVSFVCWGIRAHFC